MHNALHIDLTETPIFGTMVLEPNYLPKGAIMPVEKECVVCGKSFSVPPCRALTAKSCSDECAISVRAKSRERKVPRLCLNCGKTFEIPQSHIDRRIYCSNDCRYRSVEYRGNISDKTRGDLNPMWKGGEHNRKDGYVYKISLNHPFGHNNYVLKHRLTMEAWLRNACPESEFLVKLGGMLYLSEEAIVHHLNRIVSDNRRRNLIVCGYGTHVRIHRGIRPEVGTFWPPTARIAVGRRKPIIKSS